MTTEKKSKAFFTLNLPRRPRDGDKIVVHARLRKNPNEYKIASFHEISVNRLYFV